LQAVASSKVMMLSGASQEGLTDVLRALRALVDAGRKAEAPEEEAKPWRP
jgi:GTP-binding protein